MNMLVNPETGHIITDLMIIGGGVNGCGIARDAAGRGLSVTLVEMGIWEVRLPLRLLNLSMGACDILNILNSDLYVSR